LIDVPTQGCLLVSTGPAATGAVPLKFGTAFDVVGEHGQRDFRVNTKVRWMKEAFDA
jgi:hypothetical protein